MVGGCDGIIVGGDKVASNSCVIGGVGVMVNDSLAAGAVSVVKTLAELQALQVLAVVALIFQ